MGAQEDEPSKARPRSNSELADGKEPCALFHLNALSSPILVKIHFDVALTIVADTLFTDPSNFRRSRFLEAGDPKDT